MELLHIGVPATQEMPGEKYKDFEVSCLAYSYGYSHGDCNAAMALCQSCNYFFYVLGEKLNVRTMDAVGKGLGLVAA